MRAASMSCISVSHCVDDIFPGSALLRLLATPGIVPEQIFCACLQFVADGVFYAELNELLTRELAEHGYSGVEVRVTPMRTEIIIRATRTQNVLGECHHLHLPVTRAQYSIIAYLRLLVRFQDWRPTRSCQLLVRALQ